MQFRAGHLTLYWTHYLHVLNTILPTHTIHILYILTEWCAKVVMAYAMIKKRDSYMPCEAMALSQVINICYIQIKYDYNKNHTHIIYCTPNQIVMVLGQL